MLALLGVVLGVWLYPDATFDFVVKAAGYAGVMLLGSAVRRSKPFQTFVIACVLLLLVALLPIMLRAGHVGIALAIRILLGVLMIWRLLDGRPLSAGLAA